MTAVRVTKQKPQRNVSKKNLNWKIIIAVQKQFNLGINAIIQKKIEINLDSVKKDHEKIQKEQKINIKTTAKIKKRKV